MLHFDKLDFMRWKLLFLSPFLYAIPLLSQEFQVDGQNILSPENVERIGHQIWMNECKGTLEGLTSWNEGEEFASLGIGHFIWYPAGRSGSFKETFPDLLNFLHDRGVSLPEWLRNAQGCPWNSSVEFAKAFSSTEMMQLRQLLARTTHYQLSFILRRVEQLIATLFSEKNKEQERIKIKCAALMQSLQGIYAIIDYIHFKGEGTAAQESYQGKGWGFIQVLQAMPDNVTKENAVEEFVRTAKHLLALRVQNAPKERGEERWLKGWYKRLETYLTLLCEG